MSLSFVEDELSSASPRGPCLLVGPTQGWKTTTAEKNKCECPNVLITWAHALIYIANTHMVLYVRVRLKLIWWVKKKNKCLKINARRFFSPKDPLGHGRSTVSPRCVVGHWTPRTSFVSQNCGSEPWGGWGGRRVTGTVAVIGRRSGFLLMEPIGREVGASGRAVEGLALEVNGLAGRVVVTWVVVRGPEVTQE